MGWRCSTCAHSIDGTCQGAQCNFYTTAYNAHLIDVLRQVHMRLQQIWLQVSVLALLVLALAGCHPRHLYRCGGTAIQSSSSSIWWWICLPGVVVVGCQLTSIDCKCKKRICKKTAHQLSWWVWLRVSALLLVLALAGCHRRSTRSVRKEIQKEKAYQIVAMTLNRRSLPSSCVVDLKDRL